MVHAREKASRIGTPILRSYSESTYARNRLPPLPDTFCKWVPVPVGVASCDSDGHNLSFQIIYNQSIEEDKKQKVKIKHRDVYKGGSYGAIYGLGFIGAAVYFIMHSSSFWMGVLGIVKALFWPAYLVFKAFELLKI
jgi:hypothetical protein